LRVAPLKETLAGGATRVAKGLGEFLPPFRKMNGLRAAIAFLNSAFHQPLLFKGVEYSNYRGRIGAHERCELLLRSPFRTGNQIAQDADVGRRPGFELGEGAKDRAPKTRSAVEIGTKGKTGLRLLIRKLTNWHGLLPCSFTSASSA